jgi:putative tryptophan/tyrosine transport system substrate-binding protein
MKRRDFISLCLGLTALPRLAAAEAAKAFARVGILTMGSKDSVLDAAFREGLLDLGYVEGKNLTIEFRGAAGNAELLPRFGAELVDAGVDVIIAAGSQATGVAQKATTTIPIVTVSTNPVGLGFAASLAHPGGSITGLSLLGPEVAGKRLELLKQVVPRLSKVVAIWVPEDPAAAFSLKETQMAAEALAIELSVIEVHQLSGFNDAFQAAAGQGAGAVVLLPAPLVSRNPGPIADIAQRAKMPTLFYSRDAAKAGGLLSYGPSIFAVNRRAAYFVDRILSGAKPADLPIEQPTQFELTINLKTARALGLELSPSLLAGADEVIEQ